MNVRIRDLLQLYENTLSQHGFMRRKEELNATTNERQLCHARWMLDKMMQDAEKEKWSDTKIDRWLGFIQGILWSNDVFTIPSIEGQNKQLDMQPDAQPATTAAAPSAK